MPKYFYYLLLFICASCATYKTQIDKKYLNINGNKISSLKDSILHTFYLIGDAGNSPKDTISNGLQLFKQEIKKNNLNSTLLFLGDNIYPDGMPKESSEKRKRAERQLEIQINIAKKMGIQTFFIPGNHDWYSNGLEGLKEQESYINNALGKGSFLPTAGDFFTKLEVKPNINLLLIDSQWYINNSNKSLKESFFSALKETILAIPKDKILLIAMHHPLYSNGPHGGKYSLKDHFYLKNNKIPLPIIGSMVVLGRKLGWLSNTDFKHNHYKDFSKQLTNITLNRKNVYFLSGHDHSLQLIRKNNHNQIISGSGSKTSPTKRNKESLFCSGNQGYVKLEITQNNLIYISFYLIDKKQKTHLFRF